MARFLNHSYPGRKAVLFFVEQAAVLSAALFGAAATASVVTGAALVEGGAPLPRFVTALSEGPIAAQHVLAQALLGIGAAMMIRLPSALPWAAGAAVVSAAALYVADLYDLRRAVADRSRGGRRTLVALLAVAVSLCAVALPWGIEARAAALGAALASAMAVVTLRLALPAVVGPSKRVLVVGTGASAVGLATRVLEEAEDRVELAGYVAVEGEARIAPRERTIDGGIGLVKAARRTGADWIVVALDDARGKIPGDELVAARMAGIPCLTPADLSERLLRRIPVEGLRASELAFADGFRLSPTHRVIKRGLDLAAATIGLLLAAPILLVAALAIRLDSKGPIFYGQERVGHRGRIFRITKLRTMRTDAEAAGAPQWASAQDPRVTRVGRILRKSRVDEIPQLLSVLRGDMSLVGPRPERPYFVEQLKAQIPWFGVREAVPPGITGWAQIRYPYGSSVKDAQNKLEYDLYYIKNGSAFLDVAILFHTIRHVLTGRGAR